MAPSAVPESPKSGQSAARSVRATECFRWIGRNWSTEIDIRPTLILWSGKMVLWKYLAYYSGVLLIASVGLALLAGPDNWAAAAASGDYLVCASVTVGFILALLYFARMAVEIIGGWAGEPVERKLWAWRAYLFCATGLLILSYPFVLLRGESFLRPRNYLEEQYLTYIGAAESKADFCAYLRDETQKKLAQLWTEYRPAYYQEYAAPIIAGHNMVYGRCIEEVSAQLRGAVQKKRELSRYTREFVSDKFYETLYERLERNVLSKTSSLTIQGEKIREEVERQLRGVK